MKIVKCSTGHFFDQDKHTVCPHCGNEAAGSSKRKAENSQTIEIDFTNSKISIISKALDADKIKYNIVNLESLDIIELSIEGDNTSSLLRIIFADNHTDIRIRSNSIAKIPPAKADAGYRLMNDLNSNYKYIKFEVFENDIFAEWNFPRTISDDNIGNIAKEIIFIMFKIIDNAYPEIMKVIWS